jgi:sugar phosphate isomerase/epimerase
MAGHGVMDGVPMTETPEERMERERRQRMRSIAIAVALGAMVVMFYAATIVRMGGNVANRPLAVIGGFAP